MVDRTHQRCSSSQRAGISPSYLRPPTSGAGTFLPQAGGQLKRDNRNTQLSLRLRRENRRRRSRGGWTVPTNGAQAPSPRGNSPPSSARKQAGGQITDSDSGRAVDPLSDQVGVASVSCRLLDHMEEYPAQADFAVTGVFRRELIKRVCTGHDLPALLTCRLVHRNQV